MTKKEFKKLVEKWRISKYYAGKGISDEEQQYRLEADSLRQALELAGGEYTPKGTWILRERNKMTKEYSAQTNVNLPVELLKKIDDIAKEQKTSRSAIIRRLLINCLEKT